MPIRITTNLRCTIRTNVKYLTQIKTRGKNEQILYP